MVDAQRENGQLPGIVPSSGWGYNWGSGPAWDSALFFLPYAVYKETGDKSCLDAVYIAMKKYLSYARYYRDNGLVCYGLCDWGFIDAENSIYARMSNELSDSCYYYRMQKIGAEIARLYGEFALAEDYEREAEETRLAILNKYVKEDIAVGLSESDKSALVPENMVEEASILGVQGTLKKYDGTYEGEAQAEVNELKRLLDYTKSTSHMFYENNTITDLTNLINYSDTENVTNMASMFYKCSKLTSIPQLNTSNVTNMNYMFNECSKLTSIPQLNTSKVTDVSFMFSGCYDLEKIDISYFGITSTSYSASMLSRCYSLKAAIIRSFGKKYTLNSNSFKYCYHLTGTTDATYNPNGDKDCYIYVPKNMCDTLKSATNWSTYADQIRALEDYTIDGTTTGDLDESKI
jgi:surface protein